MVIELNFDVAELIGFLLSVLISGSLLWVTLKVMKKPKDYDRCVIVALIASLLPTFFVSGNTPITIVLNLVLALILIKFGLELKLNDAVFAAVLYTIILLIVLALASVFLGDVSLIDFKIIRFG